ncbi:MAG: anibiotic ABC transporter [Nitriliruptor sp.]|nr:MAG: anibiotic ABC transporter [Nitriliruptor sp.]
MTTDTLAPPETNLPATPASSELTGTVRLLRLAARRDRILLPVWVLSLGVLWLASVASIAGLYGSEVDRVQYAVTVAPSVIARAFEGPIFGTSLGAILMTETFGMFGVLVAVMSLQAIVRHTRLEEETGRAELVGSAVVGRHAPLTAALLLTFAANLAVGALTVVILLAYDLPVAGSLLAGLLLMGVGWSFAGIAAITAQVSASARGANGLAGSVVGLAYFLRAVGDGLGEVAASGVEVSSAWPSWLSPIGWGQQGRAFAGDRWWVLALFAVLVVATVAVAFALTRHRDVGVGMRPVRPGPAHASAALRSPVGLAWRLQRGSVLGWSVGLVIAAAVFGAIGDEVDAFLETSDELVELFAQLGGSEVLVDLFIVFLMGLLAVAVAAFAVQGVLRLRNEELAGRAEPLLSTAVARTRWMASHLTVVVVGSVGMLLAVGLAGGTAYGLVTGEWGSRFTDWVLAAVVGVPAVWVLAGLVVAAVGLLPRWAVAIGWGALGVSLVMGQLGALFELPQWVLNVSPFTHVPGFPAEQLEWLPLLVLLAVAAALTAVGLVALRRRDLLT